MRANLIWGIGISFPSPARREFAPDSTLRSMRKSTISKRSRLRAGAPSLLDLGARVRGLRRDAGLTQAEVAGPFSAAYVSAIENGKVIPSLPALVLIADRLGVAPSDLLAGVNFLAPAAYTPGHAGSNTNQPVRGSSVRGRIRGPSAGRPATGRHDPSSPG
jgi:DNA-binding XRE family transcriptional regulator